MEQQDGPSQILSYLYIGSKNDAKSEKILKKFNIQYILNCTPKRSDDPENGCPNYFEKEKKFQYKRIPIFDNRGENLLRHLDTAFKFIEESRHYGNILVHCHKGISRSVAIVIGYLMKKNELTYDEALSHIQMFRSIAKPNESFESQLLSYHPHLPTTEKVFINKYSTESVIGPTFPPQRLDPAEPSQSTKPEEDVVVPTADGSDMTKVTGSKKSLEFEEEDHPQPKKIKT